MTISTPEMRETAKALVAFSRFSVFRYRRIPYNLRWAIHYTLREAAEEIEDLRAEVYSLKSRLEAIIEVASVGTEE